MHMVFKTALTEVTTDANRADVIGAIRYDSGKWYKYVKVGNITGTVAIASGDLISYVTLTGYAANIAAAHATDIGAVPLPCGMALAAITGTLAVVYYCWVQIKGPAVLKTAVTSGAAGKRFTIIASSAMTGTVLADDFSPSAGISANTTTAVCLDCPF